MERFSNLVLYQGSLTKGENSTVDFLVLTSLD
jgi:hypothetical protein